MNTVCTSRSTITSTSTEGRGKRLKGFGDQPSLWLHSRILCPKILCFSTPRYLLRRGRGLSNSLLKDDIPIPLRPGGNMYTWLPPQKPCAEQHQYSELGSHSAWLPSSSGASGPQRPSDRYFPLLVNTGVEAGRDEDAGNGGWRGAMSAGRPTSGTGAAEHTHDGVCFHRKD